MMRIIVLFIFTFTSQAVAQTCNVRPSNETSYTISSSDNGNCLVITNGTAIETLTLPNASTLYPFKTTIFNATGQASNDARPADLVPSSGKINGWSTYSIMPAQSVELWSDGTGYRVHSGMPTPQWTRGVGPLLTLSNYGTVTGGFMVTIDTACANGDVIGFDLSWTGQSPIQFRHTIQCISTGFHDAMTDLANQVTANAAVRSVMGEGIDFPAVFKTGPYQWILYFDADYTFGSHSPVITLYKSAGAVEVMTAQIGPRSNLADAGGFACSHDTLARGRVIVTGDALCGIYVGGSTSGPENLNFNPRDALPFYAQMIWSALDTRTGYNTSSLDINTSMRADSLGQVNINNGVMKIQPVGVAQLPVCNSSIEGSMANITDSNTATWGAVIAAGGSNRVQARCNGASWTVSGK